MFLNVAIRKYKITCLSIAQPCSRRPGIRQYIILERKEQPVLQWKCRKEDRLKMNLRTKNCQAEMTEYGRGRRATHSNENIRKGTCWKVG
jgi:hypothetical protein